MSARDNLEDNHADTDEGSPSLARTDKKKPKKYAVDLSKEDDDEDDGEDDDNSEGESTEEEVVKPKTQPKAGSRKRNHAKAPKADNDVKAQMAELKAAMAKVAKDSAAEKKEADKRWKKELAEANAQTKSFKKMAEAAEKETKKLREKPEKMEVDGELGDDGGSDENQQATPPVSHPGIYDLSFIHHVSYISFYQLLPNRERGAPWLRLRFSRRHSSR